MEDGGLVWGRVQIHTEYLFESSVGHLGPGSDGVDIEQKTVTYLPVRISGFLGWASVFLSGLVSCP